MIPQGSWGQAWSPPLAPGSSIIRPCPLLQPSLLIPKPPALTPVGQNFMVHSVQESNVSMCQPCARCWDGAAVNQANLGLVGKPPPSDNHRPHHMGPGPSTEGLLSQGFLNE